MGVVECLVRVGEEGGNKVLKIRGVQGGEQWTGEEVRGELTGVNAREWGISFQVGWAWFVLGLGYWIRFMFWVGQFGLFVYFGQVS